MADRPIWFDLPLGGEKDEEEPRPAPERPIWWDLPLGGDIPDEPTPTIPEATAPRVESSPVVQTTPPQEPDYWGSGPGLDWGDVLNPVAAAWRWTGDIPLRRVPVGGLIAAKQNAEALLTAAGRARALEEAGGSTWGAIGNAVANQLTAPWKAAANPELASGARMVDELAPWAPQAMGAWQELTDRENRIAHRELEQYNAERGLPAPAPFKPLEHWNPRTVPEFGMEMLDLSLPLSLGATAPGKVANISSRALARGLAAAGNNPAVRAQLIAEAAAKMNRPVEVIAQAVNRGKLDKLATQAPLMERLQRGEVGMQYAGYDVPLPSPVAAVAGAVFDPITTVAKTGFGQAVGEVISTSRPVQWAKKLAEYVTTPSNRTAMGAIAADVEPVIRARAQRVIIAGGEEIDRVLRAAEVPEAYHGLPGDMAELVSGRTEKLNLPEGALELPEDALAKNPEAVDRFKDYQAKMLELNPVQRAAVMVAVGKAHDLARAAREAGEGYIKRLGGDLFEEEALAKKRVERLQERYEKREARARVVLDAKAEAFEGEKATLAAAADEKALRFEAAMQDQRALLKAATEAAKPEAIDEVAGKLASGYESQISRVTQWEEKIAKKHEQNLAKFMDQRANESAKLRKQLDSATASLNTAQRKLEGGDLRVADSMPGLRQKADDLTEALDDHVAESALRRDAMDARGQREIQARTGRVYTKAREQMAEAERAGLTELVRKPVEQIAARMQVLDERVLNRMEVLRRRYELTRIEGAERIGQATRAATEATRKADAVGTYQPAVMLDPAKQKMREGREGGAPGFSPSRGGERMRGGELRETPELEGVPMFVREAERRMAGGSVGGGSEEAAKVVRWWELGKHYWNRRDWKLAIEDAKAAAKAEIFEPNTAKAWIKSADTWYRYVSEQKLAENMTNAFGISTDAWKKATKMALEGADDIDILGQFSAEAGGRNLRELIPADVKAKDLKGALKEMGGKIKGPAGFKLDNTISPRPVFLPTPMLEEYNRHMSFIKELPTKLMLVGRTLLSYLQLWKASVTWVRPSYHIRNTISDQVQLGQWGLLDKHSAGDVGALVGPAMGNPFSSSGKPQTAIKAMFGDMAPWRGAEVVVSATGETMDLADVMLLIREQGGISQGFLRNEVISRIDKLPTPSGGKLQEQARIMASFGAMREDLTHVQGTLAALRKRELAELPFPDRLKEALIIKEQALYNFHRISPAAKALRVSGLVPFIAWTSKNMSAQVIWAIQNPGKYAAVLRAYDAIQQGTPFEVVREDMRHRFQVKLQETQREDGTTDVEVVTLSGIIPMSDLPEVARGGSEAVTEMFGPPLKLLKDMWTMKDNRFGSAEERATEHAGLLGMPGRVAKRLGQSGQVIPGTGGRVEKDPATVIFEETLSPIRIRTINLEKATAQMRKHLDYTERQFKAEVSLAEDERNQQAAIGVDPQKLGLLDENISRANAQQRAGMVKIERERAKLARAEEVRLRERAGARAGMK